MRRLFALSILILALFAISAVFLTARFLGRDVQRSFAEPNAFEGPELPGGFLLQRSLRGRECFIESPDAEIVIPAVKRGQPHAVAVTRIAVVGDTILGETADLDSGESRGFFIIQTTHPKQPFIVYPLSEADWRQEARAWLNADPPELLSADSYPDSAPAP